MDYVVKSYAKRKLRTIPYQQIHNSLVEKNYGFQYKEHFRKMLIPTVGIKQMEKIEVKIERTGLITVLIAELETLKVHRNDASHTYIDATKSYPAPSLTKAQIVRIYPILRQINTEIRNI